MSVRLRLMVLCLLICVPLGVRTSMFVHLRSMALLSAIDSAEFMFVSRFVFVFVSVIFAFVSVIFVSRIVCATVRVSV